MKKLHTARFNRAGLLVSVPAVLLASAIGNNAMAQDATDEANEGALEEVIVTATKRVENIQDIPISITALNQSQIEQMSAGVPDIRFMNARVGNLTIESSFGRVFPRFYIRGYGNTDFDLNASQPVSYVVDEVVQENPILKGFPVFDVERIEVLRGPQGSLFGRNTPAGIVKLDSTCLTAISGHPMEPITRHAWKARSAPGSAMAGPPVFPCCTCTRMTG